MITYSLGCCFKVFDQWPKKESTEVKGGTELKDLKLLDPEKLNRE